MFENCAEIRDHYSDYVDGVCAPEAMRSVRFHMRYCAACQQELDRAQDLRSVLRSLPRRPVPQPVDLNLRVCMSQELHRNFFGRLRVRLDNQLHSLLLPATGGLVAAIFCFCLIMGSEVAPVSNLPDVPVSFVTPARVVMLAPLDFTPGDRPVVVVTYIGMDGQVMSYKVISGQHSPELMRDLDRLIYFSRYTPAMTFGRPTDGRVVLSFSQVTIRG
ncbi:MAG: anti-sigma factor family protein [Terriglobia bacterium]